MYNLGWHAPPVGDQWLGEPPTALTGQAELLTGLPLSLTYSLQKRSRNHGAPTCNYPMESNAPSLLLLWSPLKMPHRELVVIRTHDSLITPVVFQEPSTRSGCNTGRVVFSYCADRPEVEFQHRKLGLSLGHKLDAINNRMHIVFRSLAQSVC